jgi:hypothetical protein
LLSFKIEHVCGIPQILKYVLWVVYKPYKIIWTNGYCCIPQSINKIKNLIDWVSMPPSGRKFLFCAYVIAHIVPHKSYGIIQFVSMVAVLGSPSMPQNPYLSIIPFIRRSGVKNHLKK